jgi:cytochrome c biogenesis protein CcdA
LLAYFGGILTILSPCILPVLPFVFARSGQPFRKSGLPLLAGMVVTFALIASLAAVGDGWDRLYQLIRQHGSIQDRTFRIEFLTPGVQAYSFTFG